MRTPKQHKATPWTWTRPRKRAAVLLAEDALTDQQIADTLGIDRATLHHWKKRPEFAAAVRRLADELGEVARRHAIGRKTRRLQALDARWHALQRLIAERAADPALQHVPGGQTGLLVRTLKSIGGGPAVREVEDFTLDAALLKELREHEKQAAQELGQWSERRQVTGQDGGALEVVVKRLGDVSLSDL